MNPPKIKVETLLMLVFVNNNLYEQDDDGNFYYPSLETINRITDWLNNLDLSTYEEEMWKKFAEQHNKAVEPEHTEKAIDG